MNQMKMEHNHLSLKENIHDCLGIISSIYPGITLVLVCIQGLLALASWNFRLGNKSGHPALFN